MPKCPRCQKEVYFGKGFLPLPSRPHREGTCRAPMLPLAGLWVLRAPRLLGAPILRTPSLQIPGVSQSCSPLRCGSPGCPGWVILQIHPQGGAWLHWVLPPQLTPLSSQHSPQP